MTMNVGGKQFILKSGKYTPETRYWFLQDAYNKPSKAKQEIYADWKTWFSENSECEYDYMTICSRNIFRFSLNGQITISGIEYTFLITSTRNELYLR